VAFVPHVRCPRTSSASRTVVAVPDARVNVSQSKRWPPVGNSLQQPGTMGDSGSRDPPGFTKLNNMQLLAIISRGFRHLSRATVSRSAGLSSDFAGSVRAFASGTGLERTAGERRVTDDAEDVFDTLGHTGHEVEVGDCWKPNMITESTTRMFANPELLSRFLEQQAIHRGGEADNIAHAIRYVAGSARPITDRKPSCWRVKFLDPKYRRQRQEGVTPVSIRPIELFPLLANHKAPSGPAQMP
jgi:hypothetical protein